MLVSATSKVIVGVSITARMVEKLVKVIESATLPLAKKVITLEAVPPGHVPTKIRPMVNAGSSCSALAKSKAVSGITVYCNVRPVNINFGNFSARLKSSKLSVSPMVNMMMVSSGMMPGFKTVKTAGLK